MPPAASFPGLSNQFPITSSRQASADLKHLLRHSSNQGSPALQQQSQTPPSSGGRGLSATQQGSFATQNIHGRGVSSSDLVASFMGKPTTSHSPGNATPAMAHESHNSGVHSQPQDYLLQLLNRTVSPSSRSSPPQRQQSSQTLAPERSPLPQRPVSSVLPESSSPENRQEGTDAAGRPFSPVRQFGTHESREHTPFEPDIPSSVAHTPIEKQEESSFTYVNPFERLVASSPLQQKHSGNAAPQKETPNVTGSGLPESSRRLSGHVSPAPPIFGSAHSSLNENGHDILQSIETNTPKRGSEQNTHVEASVRGQPKSLEMLVAAWRAPDKNPYHPPFPTHWNNSPEWLAARNNAEKQEAYARKNHYERILSQRDDNHLAVEYGAQYMQNPDAEAEWVGGHSPFQMNRQNLLDIGAPTTDTETVAQALNDVGDQVSRQIERALAQQGEGEDLDENENEDEPTEADVEERLHEAAVDMKKELENDGGMEALESLLPAEVAMEVREVIEEAANGNVDGHDESADDEDSSGKGEEDLEVPVYNFPMKPFVSIDLHQTEPAPLEFRQSTITDIARLKKDFDQIDRTLATASNSYIVYAMPKPGGYRVIRQDDGLDRQVFKETKDHIFNVAISNSPPGINSSSPLETCIATAMSGKVYWTALNVAGIDNLAADNFEQHCLVFPPTPANFEIASGGQLKTRAKKSTRHPEFFAIGRGKSIQIVFPLHAQSSKFLGKDHVVDTGYFKDRTLKINMGKAGKDFTFSEDDTVITTLDKAGKLRFWDIRDLVNESNAIATALAPIEIKSPLLTFSTSVANEKFWPTSVLFVDKVKAYQKGSALRYVIVGMKQNHTLQLWDLGLGKAVQEISFPHEKESDPICSIAYHAATAIVIIGHPTRNSIYFIHLSAPKYNLQGMSQATYIERIASKDPLLQKPDSTAIMSGMREYCFSSKGQIRSIDILPMASESAADPGLFELYVMHSKGVTCLNIRKADLGWSEDMRVVSSRSAEAEGMISLRELREVVTSTFSEPSSVNGEALSSTIGKPKKKASDPATSKPKAATDPTIQIDPTAPIESALNGAAAATPPIQEKSEKRKKKKSAHAVANESLPPPAPNPPSATAAVGSTAFSPTKSRQSKETSKSSNNQTKRDMADPKQISLGVSSDFMDRELQKLRVAISAEVSATIQNDIQELGRKNEEAMKTLDAAASTKLETVLKLVSKELDQNVQRSLGLIVTQKIDQSVIPTLHNITASTLRKELPDFLSKSLLIALPAQLSLAIPQAVSKAMLDAGVQQFLLDQLATKVSASVEKQVSKHVESSVLPMVMTAVVKKVREMEKQLNNNQQQVDKIDQLTKTVESLANAVNSLAMSSQSIQDYLVNRRRSSAASKAGEGSGTEGQPQQTPEQTAAQKELKQLSLYMVSGEFEKAGVLVSISNNTVQHLANCSSGFAPIVRLSSSTSTLSAATQNSCRTAQGFWFSHFRYV